MKTIYLEKVDKPKGIFKVKIEKDTYKINCNIDRKRNINSVSKKIQKKVTKNNIKAVVLNKELKENIDFVEQLDNLNIPIVDGKWLMRYLVIDILNYVLEERQENKEQTEIAITINNVEEFATKIITQLVSEYKKVTIVTNHPEKFKKIEEQLYDQKGIMLIVSNNKKKSLLKPQIILNMDFCNEILNKYNINDDAIIVNLEGKVKIDRKRFNGTIINDYEIQSKKHDEIWRNGIEKYSLKDLFEVKLYAKDSYENIRKDIFKNNIKIENLYGNNGIIYLGSNPKLNI